MKTSMILLHKLLCFLGLHLFKPFAHTSVVKPIPVEVCAFCKIGRQFTMWGGEMRFTKEAIQSATDDYYKRHATSSNNSKDNHV